MKLSDFSVINYRSITTARKIHTNNMTVLVGKNNEGKSNILRALTLAMDIMKLYAMNPRMLSTSRVYLQGRYNWERDYPVSREFDTLKSKKVPQSLEIGLFFCQIFIFII